MKIRLLLLMATILMVVACGGKSGTNTDSKQKEETKEVADSSTLSKNIDMPTDDLFYEGMLKIFCKKNYQATFKNRFLSITIDDLVLNNDSTVVVSGPLIYSENETGDMPEETEFKAIIIRRGQNKYKVTFENKGEKEWSDTTLIINYIPMK